MRTTNTSWNLQSFLDSLVYELDQARETLAIKGVNRPMSYAVKDLSLDLQLFPEYDGDQVRFKTAKPGETGASKVAITLGSITDRQIRETTREPIKADDVMLDEVEEIDTETKQSLKKMGVKSMRDFEQLEEKNIDLNKVEGVSTGKLNKLADKLRKLRGIKKEQRQLSLQMEKRETQPPRVGGIEITRVGADALIHLRGQHLHLQPNFAPKAYLNGEPIRVLKTSPYQLQLRAAGRLFVAGKNELQVVLDAHAILKMNIQ